MDGRPRLSATTLDAPDARELAAFYRRLLGWAVVEDDADWVTLRPPGGGAGLSFQTEPAYVRPLWRFGLLQQPEAAPRAIRDLLDRVGRR